MLTITEPIKTARLTLRPLIPEDLEDLYAMRSRDDVARYLYSGKLNREQMQQLVARRIEHTKIESEGDALALAVVLEGAPGRHTGVIGDMTLWWRSEQHRQGEIGFAFHPDHHGHGYATEASRAVLAIAFEALRLHRVYGRADGRNERSRALMRRLGMRQEAHFRQNEIVRGEWTDEVVFAILEDEWRARRA